MNTKEYTTYSVSNNQIIQKMNTIHSIQDKLLGNLYDNEKYRLEQNGPLEY